MRKTCWNKEGWKNGTGIYWAAVLKIKNSHIVESAHAQILWASTMNFDFIPVPVTGLECIIWKVRASRQEAGAY
jgi:hypothetical protein